MDAPSDGWLRWPKCGQCSAHNFPSAWKRPPYRVWGARIQMEKIRRALVKIIKMNKWNKTNIIVGMFAVCNFSRAYRVFLLRRTPLPVAQHTHTTYKTENSKCHRRKSSDQTVYISSMYAFDKGISSYHLILCRLSRTEVVRGLWPKMWKKPKWTTSRSNQWTCPIFFFS